MPLTKPIESVRKELEQLLVDDVAAALKALQAMLPQTSDKYAAVVAMLGRLNDANKKRFRNTLSNEELQLEYDKLRADFFDLVQGLEEADFEASKDAEGAAADGEPTRQGSILYRIPGQMPKGKETKCIIRISMSEDAILENITLDESVQVKDLYKVSDTMQAELIDPSEGKVFHIRTINEEVQIVDETGFTEWWYYVTPLAEGEHPLILKISIIELVNGQPRSKELVMEETVQIVAEDATVEEGGDKALKPAGVSLTMKAGALAGMGMVTGLKMKAPASAAQAAQAAGASKAAGGATMSVLAKTAIGLAIGAAVTVGVWNLVPVDTRTWWQTRYVEDTVEGYTDFMNLYPASQYYEPAACRKTQLIDTPEAYRDYLIEFRDGICRDDAEQALVRLEEEALNALDQDPTLERLSAYLHNFPDCPSIERVAQIVAKHSTLKDSYLSPVIEQRLKECRREQEDAKDMTIETPPMLPDTIKPEEPVSGSPATPSKPVSGPEVSPPAGPSTTTTTTTTQVIPPATPPPAPEMVYIKGDTFQMGVPESRRDDRQHPVLLRDYYLGKYEVTFAEYDLFCKATGREIPGDQGWGRERHPVFNVSWYDAVAYCNWLSEALGLAPAYVIAGNSVTLKTNANGYRLPTEAEWEFAARGGTKSKNYTYSGSNSLDEVGWYSGNSNYQTRTVGYLAANELGLHDMSGNIREWCFDRYGPYLSTFSADPTGPASGTDRILRGGQWGRNENQAANTYRLYAAPSYKHSDTGFRLARWK